MRSSVSASQVSTSNGKDRSPRRHDLFPALIGFIIVVCFCLGALCGNSGQDVVLLPVPFLLEQSISQKAVSGVQKRKLADITDRKKVKVFIGIFTNPSSPTDKYGLRRKAIRETYLEELTALPDVETKFVVGRSSRSDAPLHSLAFAAETSLQSDLYMHLDMEECYRCLPQKTAAFFMAVHEQYDADWVFKVDDDVYLSSSRILLAVEQWDVMGVDYVGCMKAGTVIVDSEHRWYEPAWRLIGEKDPLSAYGSMYAVNGKTMSKTIAPNIDNLRLLGNEDTTIGQWMLAFNVTFFEDMRLCSPKCHPHGLGVLNPDCTGVCDPEDMYTLHNTFYCQRRIGNNSQLSFMRSYPGHQQFDNLKKYAYSIVAQNGTPKIEKKKKINFRPNKLFEP